jgi:HK97 family phage portal protein
MHVRGLVLNGYMGLNPIAYARESIGLALATEKHGAKLFGHGTMIGGVLTMPTGQYFKDRTQAQKFVSEFNDSYSSVENAHRTALLENGVTWNKMAMTSVDSQFLEARNFQKKEIVDLFFGIPLGMMTDAGKSPTFASAEQFSLAYVIYALMPYLVNIEKAIYRDLLTEEEKKTYYAKFQVNGLLRGSAKERAEYYSAMINAEVMCPNEARELEDLNPYDGGEIYRTRTSSLKQQDTGKPADQGGAQQ